MLYACILRIRTKCPLKTERTEFPSLIKEEESNGKNQANRWKPHLYPDGQPVRLSYTANPAVHWTQADGIYRLVLDMGALPNMDMLDSGFRPACDSVRA